MSLPIIQVFNTLTQTKDQFTPLNDNKVNFFVCGPTVYDYPHLGHAKTYTQFDFIVRYMRLRGYEVFYLQNITDIDDKIIKRSQEQGISANELARRFEDIYKEDMQALHNSAVDKYARATDHIDQIVSQVKRLKEKDIAYETSDGIYFDLNKFSDYGKLSGRTELKENDAVSRIDESSEKKNWNDFCLWKNRKEGEPFWETEIGVGRPGWHIEDTAITETFFGPQYDIHGGAIDLIFPHHEAEIAQMEAVSGQVPFVGFWLHTGFLNINSEKMSKSLGNFQTIREVLKSYDYRTLRYFFLSNHYRTTLDLTNEVLEHAKGALKRIDEFIFNIEPDFDDKDDEDMIQNLKETMYRFMDDDFDTPRAFAAMFDFIREQNIKGKSGLRTLRFFKELNKIFDFMSFQEGDLESEIQTLIDKRQEHRANKNYQESDAIRDQLLARGIQLYDTKEGVKWRKV